MPANSRNLFYEHQEPSFLRNLRQGHDDLSRTSQRQNRDQDTKFFSKKENNDEDRPLLVDEKTGEVLSHEQFQSQQPSDSKRTPENQISNEAAERHNRQNLGSKAKESKSYQSGSTMTGSLTLKRKRHIPKTIGLGADELGPKSSGMSSQKEKKRKSKKPTERLSFEE